MPKKFLYSANKDSGNAYRDALIYAGYRQTKSFDEADFMLLDHERNDTRRRDIQKNFLRTRPIFIYPHTPLAFFLWDGHYQPLPVQCNFVHGEGAKNSMLAYGYSSRIEVCGFPRCEVKEFQPTKHTNLLFVPARNKADGSYASVEYRDATRDIFDFIVEKLEWFDSVTVCYVGNFLDNLAYVPAGIDFIKTYPKLTPTPTSDMLARIEKADIVISCETVACLSVARGKPTLFYNSRATPTTGNVKAMNYEKYRQYYQFPLEIEKMNIEEVLDVRKEPNELVEAWKKNIIGREFDQEKFLSVIREYV